MHEPCTISSLSRLAQKWLPGKEAKHTQFNRFRSLKQRRPSKCRWAVRLAAGCDMWPAPDSSKAARWLQQVLTGSLNPTYVPNLQHSFMAGNSCILRLAALPSQPSLPPFSPTPGSLRFAAPAAQAKPAAQGSGRAAPALPQLETDPTLILTQPITSHCLTELRTQRHSRFQVTAY